MIIENFSLRGRKTVLPNNELAEFDQNGRATVSSECGLFDHEGTSKVPGFSLIEGTPTAFANAKNEIEAVDGAMVVCICPPDLAGRSTACPDGRTVARFNSKRMALVPNTCRLDEVDGFRFIEVTEVAQAEAQVEEIVQAERAVTPVQQPAKTVPLEHVRSPKDNEAPKTQELQPPDPRVSQGTAELPLPEPKPESNKSHPNAPVEEPNEALVTLSEEEIEAQRAAAAALPAAQQGLLEGGAATGAFKCDLCDRDDFKNQKSLDAHVHNCKRKQAKDAPATEPVVAPAESSPAEQTPADDADQQKAVEAATKALKK